MAGLADEPVPGGKEWDGYSMLPLFESSDADWPNRYFVTHKTRWKTAEGSQYKSVGIRHGDYQLIWTEEGQHELYNLASDLSQKNNIVDQHPEVATELKAVYDSWWQDIQPHMVNDNLENAPETHKPFHERYREAFGDEAFNEAMEAMTWKGGKKFGKKASKKK